MLEILFPKLGKWGYKLQNVPVVAVPLDSQTISYLFTYCMKRIVLASSQGLALLGFFPNAISFSQSLINTDIFLLYDDKSHDPQIFSLFLRITNTEIWSKERSMGPYVAKMFFPQVDEGSSYTGVWYKKNVNYHCAFHFCFDRFDYLLS